MTQSELDVFTIRGMLGTVRILDRRLQNGSGFSQQAKNMITGNHPGIVDIFLKIVSSPTITGEDEVNYDKIDTWFADGFCNLILFLEKRLKHSAPMDVFTEAKLRSYSKKLTEILEAIDDPTKPSQTVIACVNTPTKLTE